ncbi:TIGR04438 family Trp-rich protein [Undibacterium arcticum]|uniref:TIGR04438 family Trp-rich protein n=1 Tax=Undibacterium arcticum TaxID=1762892 RepID=A0ABV7EZX5_9BURK
MPIIITIVLLSILKYFEIGPFANMSWWWVGGLTVFAFIWFEFVEPIFGWDKRKAHKEMENIRDERVKKTFDTSKNKAKRR